jgi:diguanylate cyclase (GGDEF)-like protein
MNTVRNKAKKLLTIISEAITLDDIAVPAGHGFSSLSLTGVNKMTAGNYPPLCEPALCEELANIIHNKLISTHFQPIINLQTGEITGYEALSRGPGGSPLHTPDKLFGAAYHCNMLYKLEHVCREKALTNAAALNIQGNLFININPDVVKDPQFQGGMTKHMLLELNQDPEKLVFEITERTAITDFSSFRHSINHYRRQGFSIAIDDAGAGYSSLQSIAELHPEFIKIDRSLIENIDQNQLKQALIASMVEFAHSIKARVIAEGIETKSELSTLIKLGVDWGQGFLIARPAPQPPVQLPQDLSAFIIKQNQERDLTNSLNHTYGMTIGEIVQYAPTVTPDTLVSNVEELFADEYNHGVVVLDGQKPVGLLMKNKLYFQLGTNYGVSLYYRRAIERVMDRYPLIVNADLPLEAVSQIAMSRKETNLYDLVIVVKDDKYLGTVSIMHLLRHLTNQQIRCAYNANPLTGLPGNLMIEERLKRLVEEQATFAILYLDLDNFKAFNDRYGFEHGDKALLATAGMLSSSLAQFSGLKGRDFLGHIGGDDFIIITDAENAENLCRAVIDRFDADILSLYSPEDIEKGYIKVINRQGHKEKFPVMTISIAVITNVHRRFSNFLELGEVAAELKKKAKTVPKSVYLIDRRQEKDRE